MKLNNTYTPIEQSNNFETSLFTFNNSGKLFELLSSKLYKDKISSIVRELSCNAADSHIAADNPEPFDIFLPSRLNPVFSIKDYGTALSHEEMKRIYTCYGESTKMDSNEFIGAFGLGSKTPFSYVQSFNITSTHNNTRTLYNAFINEEGIPSLTVMGQEETTDENSFEVSFPVDPEDFKEFKRKTYTTLMHFQSPVKIDGVLYKHEYENVVYQDDNIVVQKPDYYYDKDLYIHMGHVMYKVDCSELFKHQGKTNEEKFLLQWNIYMKMPIGTVEVVVSREELSYTEYTIQNIRTALQKISKSYIQKLKKSYEGLKTGWERAVKIQEDFQGLHIPDDFFKEDIQKKFKSTEFSNIRIGTFHNQKYKTLLTHSTYNPKREYHWYFKFSTENDVHYLTFDIKDAEVFVFKDKCTLLDMEITIQENRKTNKKPIVISLNCKKSEVPEGLKEIDEFIEFIGNPEYEILESIRKSKKRIVSAYKFQFNWRTCTFHEINVSNLDLNKTLYLYMKGRSPLNRNGSTVKKEVFKKINRELIEKGYRLIGIRKTEEKYFPEIKEMKYFYDYIDEIVEEFVSDKNAVIDYNNAMLKRNLNEPRYLKNITGDVQDPDIIKFKECFSESKDIKEYNFINECLKFNINEFSADVYKSITNAKSLQKALEERYPLLTELDTYYRLSEKQKEDITEYLNFKYQKTKGEK